MRVKLIHNYEILERREKEFDCENIPEEAKIFISRIKEIAKFQENACKNLQQIIIIERDVCLKNKMDDIMKEIRTISRENSFIKSSLENCISKGLIDIG